MSGFHLQMWNGIDFHIEKCYKLIVALFIYNVNIFLSSNSGSKHLCEFCMTTQLIYVKHQIDLLLKRIFTDN